ncbi:MAG: 30S ribosome-binding factor RbfA [Sulfurospirillum sp.]|nr:30S ribosome-binding factor RbfA [Sulfurospirillum sp.]MBL0702827.1 30S ribosome-binding factor RbfA [Sulfurospirillum sp.]
MTNKSIKLQRVESVLKELIPEALSTLNDKMLNGLCIVDVECTRGKYDATVYIDKMMFDDEEKIYIIRHLKKVNSIIKTYCMQSEGWFRCPNFNFKFDNKLEEQNEIDKLFAQVACELEKGKK